jgi:hypothetical protein
MKNECALNLFADSPGDDDHMQGSESTAADDVLQRIPFQVMATARECGPRR